MKHLISITKCLNLKINLLITSSLILSIAHARVDISKTTPVVFPTYAQPVASFNFSKYIPTDLDEDDEADQVAMQIGDRTIQSLMKSSEMQNTSIVRAANKVENTMKTEVSIPASSSSEVDHKLSLQFLALQSKTRMNYTGWTNASLDYDIRNQRTNFEISEKIWKNKQLILNHIKSPEADLSSMGVRWSW